MKVAQVAAEVARTCVLPMHVVSVAANDSAGVRKSAEAAMSRAVNVGADAGIPTEGVILEGKAAEQVVACAAKRQADLIVVGRRGASGQVEHLLLGSTAEKISGLAECPVLVVRT
jgi:nucleotide-binding universal stress UspA family protein